MNTTFPTLFLPRSSYSEELPLEVSEVFEPNTDDTWLAPDAAPLDSFDGSLNDRFQELETFPGQVSLQSRCGVILCGQSPRGDTLPSERGGSGASTGKESSGSFQCMLPASGQLTVHYKTSSRGMHLSLAPTTESAHKDLSGRVKALQARMQGGLQMPVLLEVLPENPW